MKKWIKILILIVVVFSATALGFFAGYQAAQRPDPDFPSEPSIWETTTFYAEIKKIYDQSFLAEGLTINDINYRGLFNCSVEENTVLLWRGTDITFTDFKVGDLVSITFTGVVLECYPSIPENIIIVQLLSDEI